MGLAISPIEPYAITMLSSRQIRAARALVGWTQDRLAETAGLSLAVINNIERGATDPKRSTLVRVQTALEGAGVMFVSENQNSPSGGEGVRLRG